MKILFILTLLIYYFSNAAGQVLDSICIKKMSTNKWQKIRCVDSADYLKYVSHSPFFEHKFQDGAVYIRIPYRDSLPQSLFIGELTTTDSIRFIDFVKVDLDYVRMCVEGIGSLTVSRNQLLQIEKFTVCTNKSSIKLVEFDLYLSHNTGFLHFKKVQPKIPANVRKAILALKENEYIITDNVKVMAPDETKRSIQGIRLTIKN